MSDTTASRSSLALLLEREQLAAALGVSNKKLCWLLYKLTHGARYAAHKRKKSNGETRLIEAPIPPLMIVQRRLLTILKTYDRPRDCAYGYVPGRGILKNARVHQGQAWVLRVDLSDFFGTINFGRVRGIFMRPPFSCSPSIATTIAQICCSQNRLPQGAPTSPILSNFVCKAFDREMLELAKEHRCYYTRYADDLVFSTNRPTFPPGLASKIEGALTLGDGLRNLIEKHGFRHNEKKTLLRHRSQRQMVTGLVVNSFPNVKRDFVRVTRTLLRRWETLGRDSAQQYFLANDRRHRPSGKAPPKIEQVLTGRIAFLFSVRGSEDEVTLRLARRLAALDPAYKLAAPAPVGLRPLRVYVEGKTDQMHLATALNWFHGRGQFRDLRLEFPAREGAASGDAALLESCRVFAANPNAHTIVCVFDRDNPQVLKQVLDGSGDVKRWGNNVFSLVLPVPDFRAGSEPLCIEMLFPEATLKNTDEHGRRIFLRKEFDDRSGRHRQSPELSLFNAKQTSAVVDGQVFSSQGVDLALSKAAFAAKIRGDINVLTHADLQGFVRVFEALSLIRSTADGPQLSSGM